ncbi:GAF domain-containing protein [Streptomyces sp. L7]
MWRGDRSARGAHAGSADHRDHRRQDGRARGAGAVHAARAHLRHRPGLPDLHAHRRRGLAARAWLARMAPITDAEGQVRGVCLAAHDFTENYLARERLQLVNEASVHRHHPRRHPYGPGARGCLRARAGRLREHRPAGPAGARRRAADGDRRAACRAGPRTPGAARRPEAVAKPGQSDLYPAQSPQADALVAGRTLVASGRDLELWLAWDRTRTRRVQEYGIHSSMAVPIQARGVTLGVAVLTRYRRIDPFTEGTTCLLAEEVTARAAVCIRQRPPLLPRTRNGARPPAQPAPPQTAEHGSPGGPPRAISPAARAGVGGDWFDVIPLSGMRVAMVVGDVVGHGIQASATMGRAARWSAPWPTSTWPRTEALTHLELTLRPYEAVQRGRAVEGSL